MVDVGSPGAVLALSGGIGGAKLVLGLDRMLDPGTLHVLANVGDDFTHLGLAICPDIDTIVYTLADLADPVRGWGRRDETWTFMAALEALGGPAWFSLGDGDLAMHVERTRRLAGGESLSSVTEQFRARLGIASVVWPATDDPVRTRVLTDEGWLAFQHYFVARRCEPVVRAVDYEGAGRARAHRQALELLASDSLRAVILCPSNPLLSLGPMLALPELHDALLRCAAPVIAVSPIVRGAALKGPTAKMLRELGRPVDALAAATCYADFLDGYVVDERDAPVACASLPGIRIMATDTVMESIDSKMALAGDCLRFADELASDRMRR